MTSISAASVCAPIVAQSGGDPSFVEVLCEVAPGLAGIWLGIYVPIAAILCGLVWWFGRKRVTEWYNWDFLVLVAPYLLWTFLFIIDSWGKSFGNVFCETILLAVATVIAPVSRVLFAGTPRPRRLAVCALLAVCAVGVLLWAFLPCLPGD